MEAQRIGIYPGTFDPLHDGHVAFARQARQACELDEVIFLPEQSPRGKRGASPIAQRVRVLNSVLAAADGLRVMRLATARFTVADTLPQLRQLFPNTTLTLLVGSDVARFMHHWEGLGELLDEMPLAVGLRGHDTPRDMRMVISELEQQYSIAISYTLVSTPHPHLASSLFRNTSREL